MEVTFSELKQKQVVNLSDGKQLGKVCDVKFTFPEGKVEGFSVSGGKGLKFFRREEYISLKCVTKIGEDTVLVNLSAPPAPKPPTPPPPPPAPCPPPFAPSQSRRSMDEYE